MNDDVKKFTQIIEYRISKGEKVTNIAKEIGLTFPTLDNIMKGRATNFRASTMGIIQDVIHKHRSVASHNSVDHTKPEKGSQYTKEELAPLEEKDEIAEIENEEPKKTEKEEMTFSEMEFILKMKEFLVSTPRHIKLSITIEKHGI